MMKNKEKYQKAFSKLHASDRLTEVKVMKKTRRLYVKKYVPILAAFVLMFSVVTAVYAADLGGIQRVVQVWIHGDQTNAVLEVNDGHYTMTYEDKDGNSHHRAGGGVAFEPDGTERPLTEEELLEDINGPDVQYLEDGSVIVYYYDQAIDITDKFEEGVCRVKLVAGDRILYMTVKYNNGFATSPHGYINPEHFNGS